MKEGFKRHGFHFFFFLNAVVVLIHTHQFIQFTFCVFDISWQLATLESIMCSLLFQNKFEFWCWLSLTPKDCDRNKSYFSAVTQSMVKELN